jgi:RNA polymerase sigma factor (sigma-70 family)
MTSEFQTLVDKHYVPLYRFALSLAHNESDAADLTQQTFCVWAEKGHQLREIGRVKSWLFTTLYREFLASRRRAQRHPEVDLDSVPEQEQTEEPQTGSELDAQSLLRALDQVDEVYRAALVLFYLKEHPYKEIADILEVPIGTVMSRLSRGKLQLREILEKQEEQAERQRTRAGQNVLEFEKEGPPPGRKESKSSHG